MKYSDLLTAHETSAPRAGNHHGARPEIPTLTPDMAAERDRRLLAPRPLTAWVCGDPPPGFSELDKRRNQ